MPGKNPERDEGLGFCDIPYPMHLIGHELSQGVIVLNAYYRH
jgi:hypothetical protein